MEKLILEACLAKLCKRYNVDLIKEYKFLKDRKFRADFAVPALKILVEYEGVVSAKSRHTTITGYSTDCDKYNLAQVMGFVVVRFTVLHLSKKKAAEASLLLERVFESQKKGVKNEKK